jgi:hypothetical protein
VYLLADGEVRPIAHFLTTAPDGALFVRAGSPSLNARGDVAFSGSMFSGPQARIFVFSGGALTEIARTGNVVGEFTLNVPHLPTIDDHGQVAFSSFLAGVLNRTDIFLFSGGVLRRLAGAGDLTAEGDTLASATNAWFNGPGQLTFVDPDAAVGRVYRLPDEGTASRVAGEGDVVPVTTPR